MNLRKYFIILSFALTSAGCITQFIPETEETQELLVVEGLITDQPGVNTVKLTRSQPLGSYTKPEPVTGGKVRIEDNDNNIYILHESEPGIYLTDPAIFQGIIGREYTLYIEARNASDKLSSYRSFPMEMKPVPPIDSIYYEKQIINDNDNDASPQEGCQVYLNTIDPEGLCKYFRWDFNETWEFRLPYDVDNQTCWATDHSGAINIKSTSALTENLIYRHPINFITNETDRLNIKYSMLINQYSISEDEFGYWKKLQNISDDVGGLYDIIPASITGNVYCTDDPNETVLGYFSVSAKSSKRIMIADNFAGLRHDFNEYCATDTVPPGTQIPGLGTSLWIIIDYDAYRVLTRYRECADCSYRGSLMRPDYWDEDK
jgi:hypothetical protein